MIELFIVGFVASAVAVTVDRLCFRKPKTTPTHAVLALKPGVSTLHLASEDGVAQVAVILHEVHNGRYGTSVQFVDYYRYMERNKIR